MPTYITFWADCHSEKEVHARNYMQMTTYFVRRVQLFPILDQVEQDEGTVMDPMYATVANFLLLMIDQDEQEVDDLDIVTKPIKAQTKEWIDGQVAQLKKQGVVLTYEGLKSEPSATKDVTATTSIGRTSKSPLITRSKKRKVIEAKQSPDPKVYSRKDSRKSPSKRPK